MKLFLVASLAILVLASSSYQSEDTYKACHNNFEIGPNICAKFNFISSEEAVKKGCVTPTNGTTFYDLSDLPQAHIQPNTATMASLITNVFEDGDVHFAFASCNDIRDMRGFTSGYAGFTTGTGDSESLIESFTSFRPNNKLAPFLSNIHEISQLPHCDRRSRGGTSKLKGYCEAWRQEACDKNSGFSQLQKDWVFKNYMIPSARYAAQSGIYSPLGQAIFYDVIIQHGFQYVEPDINIVRVLTLTGPRAPEETEQSFLKRFLTTRRELQCCYPDNVWPASATRSEDFLSLVENFEYNKNLDVPIKLNNFERTVTGHEDFNKDIKRCI
ncbi:hypothetical protein MFLAVUS_001633 [Mucor flavus]|uniref:Uncharacterized protein n=1 Tax=Mucor flavus TaxID=439312 RepID=A0ABP9YN11_9FUNG